MGSRTPISSTRENLPIRIMIIMIIIIMIENDENNISHILLHFWFRYLSGAISFNHQTLEPDKKTEINEITHTKKTYIHITN